MVLHLSLFTFVATLLMGQMTAGFPQNGILDGLRKIISGESGGLNFNFLDNMDIPDSMVPEEFRVIRAGLCGENVFTRSCDCEPGSELRTMEFPRDATISFKEMKDIFGKCRPMKCQCPNGSEILVTILGCENGGVPRCRYAGGKIYNDGPFGMMDDLRCADSAKSINAFDFVTAKWQQKTPECICANGIMPLCAKNGKRATCPDGSYANRTLSKLPPYLDVCQSATFVE